MTACEMATVSPSGVFVTARASASVAVRAGDRGLLLVGDGPLGHLADGRRISRVAASGHRPVSCRPAPSGTGILRRWIRRSWPGGAGWRALVRRGTVREPAPALGDDGAAGCSAVVVSVGDSGRFSIVSGCPAGCRSGRKGSSRPAGPCPGGGRGRRCSARLSTRVDTLDVCVRPWRHRREGWRCAGRGRRDFCAADALEFCGPGTVNRLQLGIQLASSTTWTRPP